MEQNVEQQVTRGLAQTKVESPIIPKQNYPFATETITLPSRGLVYPEGSVLASGEVTMKLLTAKEEDILTSTNLIRKGIVLDKLLESILVDTNLNINDLIIGDKNAILIAARILAFGPEYKVTITDPQENEPVEISVDMSKLNTKEIDESKLNRKNEYDFVLPKSKVAIKFKIMTHGDEVAVSKDVEASMKIMKQGNDIQARYRRLIVEVNGNRDAGYISNFVANQLLAADSKSLRKYMNEMTPDVDLKFDYTSPFTGETEALKVPIGVDFFYPSE
jgi:hypothetical protein